MSLEFQRDALSEAEAGLVAWQFSGSEDEHPYVAKLWAAIAQAWEFAAAGRGEAQAFLDRLAVTEAFGPEIAVYRRFKGVDGEAYWLDILRRAGLADRRQRYSAVANERRRRRVPASETPTDTGSE